MSFDWKSLPSLFPRTSLHPAAVAEADAAPADRPWCIALSGGADSLTLLLSVRTLWPERAGKLVALHFNHGLRGPASEGDERFCRDVCADLGVAIRSARWLDAPVRPGEAEAREARQAFFAKEMAACGAVILWTGHQKDDIAETQLMRLARGAGPAGLAAPRPVSRKPDGRIFLRPLLSLGKGEIMAALMTAGVKWREDASNATREYFRTRVRYDVLPRLQDAACNSILGGAALSRELCEEDDDALELWLTRLNVKVTPERLELASLAGMPRALWRRALRRWEPTATLSRQGFDELLALCEKGAGRMSAGSGFVDIEGNAAVWSVAHHKAEDWGPRDLKDGEALLLEDGAELRVKRFALDAEAKRRVLAGRIDSAVEAVIAPDSFPLFARSWKHGDRYQILGAPGSAKLQDLFVNRKIPAHRRTALPVICSSDGEILWVPGLPPAETAKITEEMAEAVQLTYRGGTSTLGHQSPNS